MDSKDIRKILMLKRKLEADGENGDFLSDAVDELEAQEEYKWHDLRENMYDVPSLGTVVIGYFRRKDQWQYKMASYWRTGWQWKHDGLDLDLVAWKYIEPFRTW